MIWQTLESRRYSLPNFWSGEFKGRLTEVGGYSWPKIVRITDKSCIMIVYTRCWSQDIKENIWNAISFISHSLYKATYFLFPGSSSVRLSQWNTRLKRFGITATTAIGWGQEEGMDDDTVRWKEGVRVRSFTEAQKGKKELELDLLS